MRTTIATLIACFDLGVGRPKTVSRWVQAFEDRVHNISKFPVKRRLSNGEYIGPRAPCRLPGTLALDFPPDRLGHALNVGGIAEKRRA